MPSPVSSTLTRTSPSSGSTTHRHRAVGRRVAEGVGQQVVEDALDLVGRAADGGSASILAASATRRVCASASSPRRRIDEAADRRLLEVESQRAGVDPGELEEVVDERPSAAPAAASPAGSRSARRGRPRAPRASPASRRAASEGRGSPRRRAGARVEELLDARRHLVEGRGELGQLGRARPRARAPRGRRPRSPTRRADAVERAAGSSRRRAAPRRTPPSSEPAATSRMSMSCPESNITTPESSTAASGRQTATSAEPGELQADRRERAGARARPAAPRVSVAERDDDRERDHGENR